MSKLAPGLTRSIEQVYWFMLRNAAKRKALEGKSLALDSSEVVRDADIEFQAFVKEFEVLVIKRNESLEKQYRALEAELTRDAFGKPGKPPN